MRESSAESSEKSSVQLPVPPSRPGVDLRPIAIARMLIGVLWLYSLRWKLPPAFDGGTERGLREWLALEVEHAAFGFYGRLVESVVIPNFTAFAWSLFLLELTVGLSLLTGTATRLGAVIGLALSLNLGVGLLEVPGEWPWSYAMLAMWHGVFVVSGPGRVWGVDQLIVRSDPSPLQIRLTGHNARMHTS